MKTAAQAPPASSLFTTLNTINLNHCRIGDTGALALAEALRDDLVVQQLYLCGNLITDKGVAAMASALRQNTMLQCLLLADNSVANNGAKALAKVGVCAD